MTSEVRSRASSETCEIAWPCDPELTASHGLDLNLDVDCPNCAVLSFEEDVVRAGVKDFDEFVVDDAFVEELYASLDGSRHRARFQLQETKVLPMLPYEQT